MIQICTKCVQDMPEFWPRYAEDMFKICSRYSQYMSILQKRKGNPYVLRVRLWRYRRSETTPGHLEAQP